MSERMGLDGVNRRHFLRTTAGATLGLAGLGQAAFGQEAGGSAAKRTPTDMVPLGKTGVIVSRLACGTGTSGYERSSNQTRMGFEAFVPILRYAYEAGVRFYDMADLYGSHLYMREALRTVPRDKVTLLTKVWWRWGESPGTIIERMRHELRTDIIDIVLLHCITEADWEEKLTPYRDMLSDLKAKKKIRAVGVSCHSLVALKTVASSAWVDVVMARINPKGNKMDAPPDQVVPVLKEIHDAGKGVVGMKVYGEGQLLNMREESLKFVFGLGSVDAATIGFEKREHIDDTIKLLARAL